MTERDRLDLRGLLPPTVMSPEMQIERFSEFSVFLPLSNTHMLTQYIWFGSIQFFSSHEEAIGTCWLPLKLFFCSENAFEIIVIELQICLKCGYPRAFQFSLYHFRLKIQTFRHKQNPVVSFVASSKYRYNLMSFSEIPVTISQRCYAETYKLLTEWI